MMNSSEVSLQSFHLTWTTFLFSLVTMLEGLEWQNPAFENVCIFLGDRFCSPKLVQAVASSQHKIGVFSVNVTSLTNANLSQLTLQISIF
jgi:hypothetical protein